MGDYHGPALSLPLAVFSDVGARPAAHDIKPNWVALIAEDVGGKDLGPRVLRECKTPLPYWTSTVSSGDYPIDRCDVPWYLATWRFPEMGVPPVIIHFNRTFPYKPSSYLGTGNPTLTDPDIAWQDSVAVEVRKAPRAAQYRASETCEYSWPEATSIGWVLVGKITRTCFFSTPGNFGVSSHFPSSSILGYTAMIEGNQWGEPSWQYWLTSHSTSHQVPRSQCSNLHLLK